MTKDYFVEAVCQLVDDYRDHDSMSIDSFVEMALGLFNEVEEPA